MHKILASSLLMLSLLILPAQAWDADRTDGAGQDSKSGQGNDSDHRKSSPPELEGGRPAAQPAETQWGVLRGAVRFNGEAPVPPVIADPEERSWPRDRNSQVIPGAPVQRLKNFEVVEQRKGPIRSERLLVDEETKGIRNALVFLERPTSVNADARKAAARSSFPFRADRCVFEPHVLAAMQGAEVLISTEDKITYNVDLGGKGAEFVVTMNNLPAGEKFDPVATRDRLNFVFHGKGKEPRGASLQVQLKAGSSAPMLVVNSIHPWMSAWWLVLDHPYFAVTDEHGRFEIRDVPSGPQRVIVWHESLDPRSSHRPGLKSEYLFEGEVVVKAEGATTKDFLLKAKSGL